MPGSRLHDMLERRKGAVLGRWVETMQDATHGRAGSERPAPPMAVLDELSATLRVHGRGLLSGELRKKGGSAAGDYGATACREGREVSSVVHDYGALREAILGVARDDGMFVSPAEDHALCEVILASAAEAAGQYLVARETALRKHTNEQLAFIAHELRSPLWSASLALTSLENKGLIQPHRFLGVLERGLARMTELLQRSLELASLSSGARLEREHVAVQDLLTDVVSESTVDAEDRGVALRVEQAEAAASFCDPKLLRTALLNVVRQALDVTPRGGTVHLRCVAHDGTTHVEVEDESGGLSAEAIDRLFVPFSSADPERGRFGVGLAVAKQVMEAHGGTLQVGNRAGMGSVYTLALPVLR